MLGAELAPRLRQSGNTVIGHSRRGPADVVGDFADAKIAETVLDSVGPDVVVNLAAATNVDACERDPNAAYAANTRVVENICGWLRDRRNGGTGLIQISTDQVYDAPGANVESNVRLTNYYAFSKFAGELAAAGCGASIIRTNFVGPSKVAGRASLTDWLMRVLRAGEPVTLFDDVFFSPLSMATLVERLVDVIRDRPSGVFNLGAASAMSKAEFAMRFAKALDLPTTATRIAASSTAGLAAYRPKGMAMDSTRIEAALAIRLPTLEQEIELMKEAYSAC